MADDGKIRIRVEIIDKGRTTFLTTADGQRLVFHDCSWSRLDRPRDSVVVEVTQMTSWFDENAALSMHNPRYVRNVKGLFCDPMSVRTIHHGDLPKTQAPRDPGGEPHHQAGT